MAERERGVVASGFMRGLFWETGCACGYGDCFGFDWGGLEFVDLLDEEASEERGGREDIEKEMDGRVFLWGTGLMLEWMGLKMVYLLKSIRGKSRTD